MKIWKVIAGAAIGVAAVAAAPFTGGGSVLAGATLAESLTGAGFAAVLGAVTGGTAGAVAANVEDDGINNTVKEAKESGFDDGLHEGKAETVEEVKKFADYDLALTALVYYFARCDGSISKEEEQEIDYALNAIMKHENIPDQLRAELDKISRDENLTFEEMVLYLDKIPLKELCSFTEYVSNIVEASDGITPAEATAKQKFEEYLQGRKCAR